MKLDGSVKRPTGSRAGTDRRRRERFEGLLHPHARALYRTALRMVGNSQTAEDMVQEACLKAYRSFDSYDDGTNFKAWVFRIMANLCIDHKRRNGRAPFVEWDETKVNNVSANAGSASDQPDVLFLHTSFRVDAFRAIARLSPEVRVVVSLALLEEFTYEEIAAVVECPVGTVRSRLNRGRIQLRRELHEYTPEGEESPGIGCTAKKRWHT